MPGRAPDYDVCIVQEYAVAGGAVKAKWFKLGVAWRNEKSGSISVTMVNMPGVKIMLVVPKPGKGGVGSGTAGEGGDAAFGEPQYDKEQF